MKIVFTKNKLPLSWFIRWIFDEPVSHAAFLFDGDKWVFESNLVGTKVSWSKQWKESQEIVHSLNYDLSLEQEEEIFQSLLNEDLNKGWDFKAALWLGFYGMRKKLLGMSFPTRNPLNSKKKLLCHEVVERLPEWVTGLKRGFESSAITPYLMYIFLRSQKDADSIR